MSQPDVTTNGRVMANSDTSENRRVGVDRYVVLEHWMARNVQHVAILVIFETFGA